MPYSDWTGLVMALMGWVFGGFCTVMVHRLPKMIELVDAPVGDKASERFDLLRPRSHCPQCQTPLAWHDVLPIWGYLCLRGRCRHCHRPIGVQYLGLELAVTSLFVHQWWVQPTLWAGLVWAGFASAVLTLAVIDAQTRWLPDEITQPLLWGGLLASMVDLSGVALPQAVGGAVAGYMSLWGLNAAFVVWRGREGMGHGDFKFLAALGAWFGTSALLALTLLASVLALAMAAIWWVRGELGTDGALPFGPFLAAAAAWHLWVGLPAVGPL